MTRWGHILRKVAEVIGTPIRDVESEELLGKAIVLALGSRIWVLGYTGTKGLRPVAVLHPTIRYWVQELRFAAAETPNYPNTRGPTIPGNQTVALALVSHESADTVDRMIARWTALTAPTHCLLAYGGPTTQFEQIRSDKVLIPDPRLRTRDHQREFQSYSKLLAAVVAQLADKSWNWLFFAEYDLIPLVPDFFVRIIAEAEDQNADVLAVGAVRLDNTLHPHHGAHASNPDWSAWIESISCREDPKVVLSCLGCGQLWRREALEAVVAAGEVVDSYLEILLPSIAHHLGFRVRPWKSHADFILPDPLPHQDLDQFQAAGASAIHPLKGYWAES